MKEKLSGGKRTAEGMSCPRSRARCASLPLAKRVALPHVRLRT